MIKIRQGYAIHDILDEHLIIGTDGDSYMPNCIMSLNETGLFLYNILNSETDEETLVKELVSEYDVDRENAVCDVQAFLQQLKNRDMIEEC